MKEGKKLAEKKVLTATDVQNLRTLFDATHLYVAILKLAGDSKLSEEVFAELLEQRKQNEHIFFDLGRALDTVAQQIAKETSLTADEVFLLSDAEIVDYLEGKQLPDSAILEKRKVSCAFLSTPKGFQFLEESEYQPILDTMHEALKADVLHGQPAYKGLVTGTCFVVRDFFAEVDMPDGSILVTGMTDPRFLTIMKKASAIVTDAGGALAHAAIVSREFGIPCVVGTKIATEVLKNGDKVEVDANNGVVRILDKGGI